MAVGHFQSRFTPLRGAATRPHGGLTAIRGGKTGYGCRYGAQTARRSPRAAAPLTTAPHLYFSTHPLPSLRRKKGRPRTSTDRRHPFSRPTQTAPTPHAKAERAREASPTARQERYRAKAPSGVAAAGAEGAVEGVLERRPTPRDPKRPRSAGLAKHPARPTNATVLRPGVEAGRPARDRRAPASSGTMLCDASSVATTHPSAGGVAPRDDANQQAATQERAPPPPPREPATHHPRGRLAR